jgi:hypothetical protein
MRQQWRLAAVRLAAMQQCCRLEGRLQGSCPLVGICSCRQQQQQPHHSLLWVVTEVQQQQQQ